MTFWVILLIGISLKTYAFPHEDFGTFQDEADIEEYSSVEKNEICETEACRQVAEAFHKSMNTSADPCVDFHEYACGNWMFNAPESSYIHESIFSALDRFSALARSRLLEELETEPDEDDLLPVQKMKTLYKSCMDNETRESEGLKPIMKNLHETNGWPMIMDEGTWVKNAMPWQKIDDYYQKLLGLNAFYSLIVMKSPSGRGKLWITTPRLISQAKLDDDITEYRALMKDVLQLLVEENEAHVSDEELEKDIDDMLAFADTLYEASQNAEGDDGDDDDDDDDEDDDDYDDEDDEDSVEDDDIDVGDESFKNLNSFIKWWNDQTTSTTPKAKIHWKKILGRVMKIANIAKNNNTRFSLENKNYFIKLVEILESTDERIIVNYIQWNFLVHVGEFSVAKMSNIISQILQIDSSKDILPRSLDCIPIEEPAAIHLFGKIYYTEKTKRAVDEMLTNIKKSFALKAIASNWLSRHVKRAIIETLQLMINVRGYPRWYDDEAALLHYYKKLKINNNHFENMVNLMKNTWINNIQSWGKSKVKLLVTGVLEANAEYDGEENQLYVPAANFQPPLFDGSLPQYVGYPTVGFTFGHEIGHMVDIDEIRSGIITRESLFTRDMSEILLARVQCFVEVFNELSPGSGNDTLNENIADHFGIQAAFHAYREMRSTKYPNGELKLPGFETFSDEKMFFISYAEQWCSVPDEGSVHVHSSDKDRILGLVSNTLSFAKAFNCPKGSPMHPEQQCDIWIKPPSPRKRRLRKKRRHHRRRLMHKLFRTVHKIFH